MNATAWNSTVSFPTISVEEGHLDSQQGAINPGAEGKRTRMPSEPSSAIPARFPAPRRGPQSASGPHRQRSRGGTALSLPNLTVTHTKKHLRGMELTNTQ